MTGRPEALVSAIIICRDGKRFLAEAVESVLNQSHPALELLLVDDGSEDGAAELAQEYARRLSNRIRYLEHEGHVNRGMAASRNLGIREAHGEFIAFLDADDKWLPRKIEQQLRMLMAEPSAAMIYGRTLMWYSWASEGLALGADYIRPLEVLPNRVVPPPQLLLLALANDAPLPSNSNAMWRRAIIDAIGFFDESFPTTYSDVPFYVKLLREYPVLVASEVWDLYRQHGQNSVRRAMAAGEWHPQAPNRARAKLLDWVSTYCREVNERRPSVLRALRYERLAYDHPYLYRLLTRYHVLDTSRRPFLTRAVVHWRTSGVRAVEIRVNRADGSLFSSGGPSGSETTGRWVSDGMTFFLLDASDGGPASTDRMLATATVWLDGSRCFTQHGSIAVRPGSADTTDPSGSGPYSAMWSAASVTAVEIRRDEPDGPLVARGGAAGEVSLDAMPERCSLLMQNASAGLPPTSQNTLARIEIRREQVGVSLRSGTLTLDVESLRDSRGWGRQTARS